MVLFVFSSCSVRKGIQSFFSDVTQESTTGKKSMKRLLQVTVSNKILECGTSGLNSDADEILFQRVDSKTSAVNALFYILPGFIISNFTRVIYTIVSFAGHELTLVYIPLYLQNRLLLI